MSILTRFPDFGKPVILYGPLTSNRIGIYEVRNLGNRTKVVLLGSF